MITIVKPKRLSGFRDFFAQDVQLREYVINTFKKVFENYGYEPLETPALEYTNIFTDEAGEEAKKLFYRFIDQGSRDIMLKYEVMISMCRAVAQNINNIVFPYKRYQIQKVWRAEKPQKGRFREFTQCDADTIGSSSIICDAEFIQMGIEVLQTLGFEKFKANINNRKFLNGIIKYSGGTSQTFIPICLSIDKLPKIGSVGVKKELMEQRNIPITVVDKIIEIITLKGESEKLLKNFKIQFKKVPIALEGLEELEQIFNYLKECRINEKYYQFTPFIARGLAYYTGPIWEFDIKEGGVGSVAGCGRYDNTIGRFVGSKIPATGGSFGIERIIEILKKQKIAKFLPSFASVLVTYFAKNTFKQSLKTANKLRKNKIATILYPQIEKLDRQLKYADKKGIRFVVIIGPDEAKLEKAVLKDLQSGKQVTVEIEQIAKKVLQNLPL